MKTYFLYAWDALRASYWDEISIESKHVGYVQAIDGEALQSLARKYDCVIVLHSKPGDFLPLDFRVADARFREQKNLAKADREHLEGAFNESLIVGRRRTPRQDVECAVDELVEVAARSLSPGINDPFTAVNCIDHLGSALSRLVRRKLPTAYRYDDDGRLCVIVSPVCFGDVLNTAFNQIRQYGRNSVAVTIRLLEALECIANHVQRDEDRVALRDHACMILRLSEAFKEQHDRKLVQHQYDRAIASLAEESQ